jgi:branched-chain amino acid aminotransferase
MKVYINGAYYEEVEAKLSVFDHGFLYGDGIFEGIRIYGGKIFKLEQHVRRLFDSAKGIHLDVGMTPEAMEKLCMEAVTVNQKKDGYIRLIVSRGIGSLGIDPLKCPKPSVVVIVGDIEVYPQERYSQGIAVITSSYRRIPVDCFDVRIKSLNYLNNVLAKMEAQRAGCLESIILDRDGYVTECTADNIFIVKHGELATPPASQGALEGITRAEVFSIASRFGIPASEKRLTRFDCSIADECFLTGTGAEIMPVTAIDKNPIGDGKPGAITRKLMSVFKELVKNPLFIE